MQSSIAALLLPILALASTLPVLGCATNSGTATSPTLTAPQIIAVAPAFEPKGATRLAGTAHYTLSSQIVDQRFGIDVSVPPGPGPFPVVYVLDGNLMFPIVHQLSLPMVYAGDLPPAIYVGIGYEVERPEVVAYLRVRDLTPTYDPTFVERMARSGMPLPPRIKPGGANAFLSFIEKELKPFIESRYAVDPGDQTLVGDSFGGLFALHVLFSVPTSFDRYVVGSPSISWDGGQLLRDEAGFAKRASDLPVHLFLSAGALESSVGTDLEMVSNMEKMADALASRNYLGLRLTRHVFPDETHTSVIGATLSRGLRAVFERTRAAEAPTASP